MPKDGSDRPEYQKPMKSPGDYSDTKQAGGRAGLAGGLRPEDLEHKCPKLVLVTMHSMIVWSWQSFHLHHSKHEYRHIKPP